MQPVFRFAPSPNGYLHAGHAYSALLNAELARRMGGVFLLRIEDIDLARCRPEMVAACLEDLEWLGLDWQKPVLRQSEHFARYAAVAAELQAQGLLYPCFCTRASLAHAAERDPDGAPLYPGTCRHLTRSERGARIASGEAFALRLDMAAALRRVPALDWAEAEDAALARYKRVACTPAQWGDVVLVRKDCPTSYHLAVVLDDARQGVTHVVRGRDLFAATAIHRLLQQLLGLPAPRYFHHDLLRDDAGKKLAKSASSTPLRQWRAQGLSLQALRERLGFA